MVEGWDEAVLAFWFEELKPEDWFTQSDSVDAAIRARFLSVHQELKAQLPEKAMQAPCGALAATLALDQFPRNIFRRKAEAFATDGLALKVARNAIDSGFDSGFTDREKQFLYMPLMHSETLADQEQSVVLFTALGNEDGRKYAIEHRDIIARFGRFPHRNRVLGRATTSEETTFLESHDGYGQ